MTISRTPRPTQRPTPRWAALALAALGLLAAPAAQAAKTVTVKDMGELGTGLGSFAQAINNNGRTVGTAMSPVDFQHRQVAWQGLKISEFDNCCAGFLPTLRSINLGGEVVGDHFATRDDSLPVYWTAAGVASYLPGLSANGFGYANAINNAGKIAGAALDASSDTHAVIWDRTNSVQDLGFLGEPDPGYRHFTMARGINNLNQVVGDGLVGSARHAFLWQNGSYTDLGLGTATHINDQGLIAGYAPGFIPVTWKDGVRKNLPALGGGSTAYGHRVNGINNQGDLVGHAPGTGIGLTKVAVLWRGGKVIKLGNFPGGTTSDATGINDKGQIVGSGNLVDGGPHHALRWTVKGGKVSVAVDHP